MIKLTKLSDFRFRSSFFFMLLCFTNKNFSPKCFSLVTNTGAFKNIHEADIRAFVCNKKDMDTGPDTTDVKRTVTNPPQREEANFTSPGLLDTKL